MLRRQGGILQRFDKRIVIYRDPRDNIVSRFLVIAHPPFRSCLTQVA
jgi:hypothetical protein